MRKEHLFFLTLLTAAAVIAGSTVSLAANMKYIVGNVEKPAVIEEQNPSIADNNQSVEYDSDGVMSSRGSSDRSLPAVEGSNYIAMTNGEKQQILEMMNSLGMKNKDEYAVFITDFQTKHSLQPTGVLDSTTLDAIIKQVKLQRTLNEVSILR